jgi:hypothetical protein
MPDVLSMSTFRQGKLLGITARNLTARNLLLEGGL